MSERLPSSGLAALALAGLCACSEPAATVPPPPPEPTAAAQARLAEFAEPASWEDLDPAHPGTRLRDPRTGIVFRRIPKGVFAMGADDNDPLWRPRHEVELSRDWLLAETELTIGQWRLAVREFAIDPTVPVPDGDDALPMTLSCRDAEQFARRFGYRLPTEAEWERACCGGLALEEEPWRSEAGMREHAWFHRNSESRAHAVATRAANPYGLFDMLGNLWEWCGEDFDPAAYQRHGAHAVDPRGTQNGSHRVLRGGSWFSIPPATPRTRSSGGFAERTAFFGARFARDVTPR